MTNFKENDYRKVRPSILITASSQASTGFVRSRFPMEDGV